MTELELKEFSEKAAYAYRVEFQETKQEGADRPVDGDHPAGERLGV